MNSVFSRSVCYRYPVSRFRVRAKRSRFQGIFLSLKNMVDLFDYFMVSMLVNYGNDTRKFQCFHGSVPHPFISNLFCLCYVM